MSNTKSRKLLSLILAVLMAASALVMPVFAAETQATGDTDSVVEGTTPEKDDAQTSLTDIKELMSIVTYKEYLESYKNAAKPDGFSIDVSEYDVENSAEDVKLLEDYEGKDFAIETGEYGRVTFNINVPEAGLYCIRWDYMPTESDSTTNIERSLYVNKKVPYSEARNVIMTKRWVDQYVKLEDGTKRFEKDQNGNEIRPDKIVEYKWQTYELTDYNGYYNEPLAIYLEEGENTIALEGSRHGAIFADFELFQYKAPKSYDEVMADYEKKGYKNATGEPIYIDAETPIAVSSNQIYATNDPVSSATQPQSPNATIRNTIKYANIGGWVEYEFPVEESGIYTLMFRFRQDQSSYPVNRKIIIDGEVPYDAAETVSFKFEDGWQTGVAMSGDRQIKVYLEGGKTHKIRIQASLGDIGKMLRDASDVQSALNKDYLEILRLTGAEPDEYRDYGFSRVMPDTMRDLVDQANVLKGILEELEGTGQLSEATSTLTQIEARVRSMGTDEDEVAKNLGGLKSDLSSLASWVSGMLNQSLELDYIQVQSPDAKIPKPEAGFFAGAWFEIQKFVASFFVDYNSLSGSEGIQLEADPVEVWTASSRDQAQIIKDYANDTFTINSKIPVNVKLVAGGTLVPSMLAGIGPDVALDGMTSTNQAIANATGSIIDLAIRGAVKPLQNMDGFNDVKAWFPETAFQPVTLYGDVFGVPTSLDWSMMFYRKDIFATLGIEVPKTWDDIMASVPVLQFNNMEVGLAHDTTAFATFIFQNGGEFWADDGMRVNFETNTSLEAFEYMTNMFTQYSLPLTYDALNRFKTGEVPLFLGSYITYNTITIYATELAGLWGFTAMPGTLQPDGTIDRTVVASADAVCIVKSCDDEENAWKFVQWYCDKDFQVSLSNELVNLLGESGMRSVAHLDAIAELPWKEDDRNALVEQIQNVVCLPQYPGSYFISRYINFAVNNAYNEGMDPVESLLGYVSAINKEIKRKRQEFGFETIDVGQTLAEKRFDEAIEMIDDISDEDAETYKDVIADVRKAYEADVADIAAIEAAAKALEAANKDLFKDAAAKMMESAKWYATYDN